MRTRIWGLWLCAAVLIAGGCRSLPTQVELSPTDYTVTAVILDLSNKAQQLLTDAHYSNVDRIVRRWDTKVTRLPTIHIRPKQTRKVETGELHTYPIEFDADGNPTRYQTTRDGLSFEATFSIVSQDRVPRLETVIKDSRIVDWKTVRPGHRFPVCRVREIGTTVFPKWGQWQDVGVLAETKEDNALVVLVRIDQPEEVAREL